MADSLMSLRQPDAQPDLAHPFTSMAPALAALRGLTSVASDGAAKRAAEEIVKRPPMEISTKVDPKTGETLHTIKNVTGSALEMSDDDRVKKAAEAPQQQMDAALASLRQKVANDHALKSGPVTPDQTDTWRENYQLQREGGLNPLAAAIKGSLVQGHVIPRARAEREGTQMRMQKINEAYRQDAPMYGEAARMANEAQQGASTERAIQRGTHAGILNYIAQTDLSGYSYDDALKEIASQAQQPLDTVAQKYGGIIQRQIRQQASKKDDSQFDSFRRDKGLGTFASMDAVKQSYGPAFDRLPPAKQAQIAADYQASRTAYTRAAQDQALQVQASQRAAAASERAAANASAKPQGRMVNPAHVVSGIITPDTLLRRLGRPGWNQESVEDSVTTGVQHFQNSIAARNAKIEANGAQFNMTGDTKLQSENRRLIRENQRDRQHLDTLAVGVKQINAIDAYMEAAGITDRNVAIQKLRAAGRIK